ncbi:hypothetical protein UFOVP1071_85 [uncultured Caudovirales phage]|uniref:Uncharacterized protein n=1 Tax=uncultured Caudovirales phage TaxID=2100421 RepID=A0A6J5QM50_9CAUD|nr:hypothetical protein UFOVP1071_85 [uncultured Caudovirales phage]
MSLKIGSNLMSDIIDELKERVLDDAVREEVYSVLIEAFQDRDCDTLAECYGDDSAFDAAYDDIHFDEDDELNLDDYFEEDDEVEEEKDK